MGNPVTISDEFVTRLSANEDLLAFIREGDDGEVRIYAAATLGQGQSPDGNPAQPDLPYVVWNELPSNPSRVVEETSNSQQRFFTFWVYDTMGSLSTINAIMRIIRAEVKDLSPVETTDDGRCTESRWMGLSGNFPDEPYNTSSRYGTLRLQMSE